MNCLVTGGSRGLGLAICEDFKKRQHTVFAPSREELDLSSEGSVRAFLKAFNTPIDVLINNAGINELGQIPELSEAQLQRMLQVNLISCFQLVQKFAPLMAKNKFGRIVNVTSVYGGRSRLGRAAYSMTKSGLDSLSRSITVEFASQNVLANSVSPGFVDTELTRKNNSPEQIQKLLERVPAARLAKADEIASVISFLAFENTFIAGQNIVVDGGYTCL